MTKKIRIWIVICFLVSIGAVGILVAISDVLKDNRNSFLREFPSHPVLEGNSFDLQFNSYYIAGGTSKHIYLGNYSSPLHLLILNTSLTDSQHVKLNVKGILDQKFWSARIRADSTHFYLHDGAVPRIYRGSNYNWTAERIGYDNEYFLDIEPIGKRSFFIKSLSLSEESILGKISADSPHYKFTSTILTKQVDGVFCTDGTFSYDQDLSKVIYVYRYRNEFIVMDTNLNVAYRGNTIDTVTRAKIKVDEVGTSHAKTLSAPPLVVNKQSSAYKDWLFINSDMLSKNEHPSALNEGSVIDVYNLRNAKYLFSFYIFNYEGKEKLREFRVFGNRLVVLFDTHLKVYELRGNYFKTRKSI
jgi:hypothetical protein